MFTGRMSVTGLVLVLFCLPAVLLADASGVFSKGILFKLERTGEPVSYVMGTVHSGDPRVLALPQSVREAFAASEQYVMEARLDGGTLLSSLGSLWLLDGRSLSEVIGEELFQQVVQRLLLQLLMEVIQPTAQLQLQKKPEKL